jgi:TonB family protein
LFLAVLFLPAWLPEESPQELAQLAADRESLRFVEVVPSREFFQAPRRPAVQSDADRRSMTRERAPQPENDMAFSRGNTPEPVVGGPQPEPPGGAPPPPESAMSADDPRLADASETYVPVPREDSRAAGRGGSALGQTLRDLQRYLRQDNFDNAQGGDTDLGSDLQFDSKGVDFGPWLRRFKHQIESNWLVPQAAGMLRGRVIVQFYVLRNGAIVDLRVIEPATVPAFTTSSLNALRLSNPTAALPPEYPDDRVLFTVTFRYN